MRYCNNSLYKARIIYGWFVGQLGFFRERRLDAFWDCGFWPLYKLSKKSSNVGSLKKQSKRIQNGKKKFVWKKQKNTLLHVWPVLVPVVLFVAVVVAAVGYPAQCDIERCANSVEDATKHLFDNLPIRLCRTLYLPSMQDTSIGIQKHWSQPKYHPIFIEKKFD